MNDSLVSSAANHLIDALRLLLKSGRTETDLRTSLDRAIAAVRELQVLHNDVKSRV
jgi:hypothetical protein